MYQGWALVEQGQGEEGIAQIFQGLANCQAAGAVVYRRLALLAEAYRRMGQPEAGLRLIAEALATAHHQGDRRGESELYRLKGELLLKAGEGSKEPALSSPATMGSEVQRIARTRVGGDEESPEGCFLKAIGVAQQQSAKSLELRAVLSLSRSSTTARKASSIWRRSVISWV